MTTRKTLRLMPVQPKPRIPYSMLRRAVALFRTDLAPRSVRRHNARNWIRAMEQLGDKHIYKGAPVRWGHRSAS